MLYRKSVIDKMKSPDELDKVQEVAGPMNILAIIGFVIFIAAYAAYIFLV